VAIGPLYRPLVEVAREFGVDVAALLAPFELSVDRLFATDMRLSPDQGRALGRALLRALPAGVERCELGLRAAERFAIRDADLLGYIVTHSEHPLAAARALADHARLLGDSADFRVETANGRVVITLGLAGGKQMLPEGSDFMVAAVVRLIRDGSQGKARPIEVKLPRPEPKSARMYDRYFGVPVQFAAPAATLVYDEACMLVRFSQSDRRLAEILEQHARQQMCVPASSWQERVRGVIADGLVHGDYAAERVAWRCGVGERTLRRRLAQAGTTYRALVDDVRKERALLLLANEDSVSSVAQHLGFSDATAFARAFRRWTGVPPHQHARAQRN
jgi:AraC-like DNA-binding protein